MPTDFLTVGESPSVAPTPNIASVFASSITVKAGDLLGLRIAPGPLTDCGVPTESFDDLLRGATGANPAVGTTASLAIGIPSLRLTIGATVETDADGDGLGDDTQDSDDDGDGVRRRGRQLPGDRCGDRERLPGPAAARRTRAAGDRDGAPVIVTTPPTSRHRHHPVAAASASDARGHAQYFERFRARSTAHDPAQQGLRSRATPS